MPRHRGFLRCLLVPLTLLLGAVPSGATTFCVDSVAALRTALASASANGGDDEIRVVVGHYRLGGTELGGGDTAALELGGGWSPGCLQQSRDASRTVLDAERRSKILTVTGSVVVVSNFTFARAHVLSTARESALYAFAEQNFVVNNRFLDNVGGNTVLGASVYGAAPYLQVSNNLFARNAASSGIIQLSAFSPVVVSHNTVVDNSVEPTFGNAALRFSSIAPGFYTVHVANNLFWDNGGADVHLFPDVMLENNLITRLTSSGGVQLPGSGGNVSIDPRLVGNGDYRLRHDSPVRDLGLASPPGGVPFTDLDGRSRSLGAGPDLGAFESCSDGDPAWCLAGGRFRVEVGFRTQTGQVGRASPVALTGDTGYGWFFRDTNVELVLKILDACSLNDRFWVFVAGLTNVEVSIEVTDLYTGIVRTYDNPLGRAFPAIQDVQAFGCAVPD
jgi:hypothetical protein